MSTRNITRSRRKSRKTSRYVKQHFFSRLAHTDWSNPLTFSLLMLGLLVIGVGILIAFNGSLNDLWNSKPADRPANNPNMANPATMFGRTGGRNSDIPRIGTSDLAMKLDSGSKVIVIDVREEKEWALGHIKGAINIPTGTLEKHLDKLPQDAEIVTYCACPAEETSAALARSLRQNGYTSVRALKGGYEQWVQEQRPIEK